jgi:hypothetical protein
VEITALIELCKSSATWFILIVIWGGISIVFWRSGVHRETWEQFYNFMLGLAGMVFGVGYGFKVVQDVMAGQFALDYSIASIGQLMVMVFWAVVIWRTWNTLTDPDSGAKGWRWLGILVKGYTLGAVANIIVSGGRTLPFVEWFV